MQCAFIQLFDCSYTAYPKREKARSESKNNQERTGPFTLEHMLDISLFLFFPVSYCYCYYQRS